MDPQGAADVMQAAGFDPLEPYKSAQALWRCQCRACEREVQVKYVNVKRGYADCPLCVDDQRVAIMRNAGLEPLEPYPGTNTGWRSRCAAGHVVTPWFASVRAGRSSGCFYCAGLAPTPPEEAEAEARAAGYDPLEPYPLLTKAKWRCRHLLCGDEVLVRLESIRARKGCCMRCGTAASATARAASAEGAAELMRSAGLRPLEPYPGSSHLPWRSECLTCGAPCSPTRANLWRGQGGCVDCGVKLNAALRLGDADQAFLDIVAAGLLPQAPYAGVNKPWPCRCTECGSDVQPRLSHVRSRGGGCLQCRPAKVSTSQLGDPQIAALDVREAGYEPLEPYPGAAHRWSCRHMICGNQVAVRLDKIRRGEGCCGHCAPYGFKLSAPAILYLLHHDTLSAVKIGITGGTDRTTKFRRNGWTVVETTDFATGAAARTIEQAVLRRIRGEMRLTPFLNPEQVRGTGGWSETFNSQLLPPATMRQLVAAARNELRI